jgi:tetratricopeptide (TPR) repeat protein
LNLKIAAMIAASLLLAGCGDSSAPRDAAGLLQQGWQSYAMGDFDFALDSFRKVERMGQTADEERFSALLGLATTYHLSTNPDLAKAAEYYAQLQAMGTDEARQHSLLGMALIAISEDRSADAQTQLMGLIEQYPDSMLADEAVLHLADSLLAPTRGEETGEYDLPRDAQVERGIRVLEQRLESHPENPLAAQMHIMVANQYIGRGDYRKAVDHLLAAEECGIGVSRTRSTVLWQIARVAEKQLKDYDLAETFYALYVHDFPRTALYYRASQSLKRVQDLRQKAEG